MIDVAIRFDDPSATSDHALERAILHAMAAHDVCATFAVIPYAGQQTLPAGSVPHLVEAQQCGRVEIAQHGFSHEPWRPEAELPSEFSGLDPAAQTEKIAAGRAALEQAFGVAVTGFVPPFNTFDHVTAAVLSSQGFLYLSAGGEHGVVEAGRLAQLPRTCQITELRHAVSEARRRPQGDLAVVAVMHHYDFRESGHADAPLTLQNLAELFRWLRQQPEVRLNTLGQLAARHDAETWRRAVWRSRWVQQRHWRIRSVFPRYGLMPHALFKYVRLTGSST
ncbi:MAG: polysaccharide deacetylase family protein [Hydrogenophilales bacterium]|nr:polysaccharide deacetylase family protein [Hydrogenophilales bacterium]